MKYILSLVLVAYCLIFSFCQGIEWETSSWDQALSIAESNNKLIFVDLYTTWCGPCIQMDKEVFPHASVGDIFNEHFVSYKLDAEDSGEGARLAKFHNVNAYPTLLFIDSKGTVITSTVGMKNKYELIELANQSLELNQNMELITEMKHNLSATYSLYELQKVLSISRIHKFQGKELLAMSYLDYVNNISEEDLRNVMGEVGLMELSYLERLAPLTSSLSYSEIYLRKNSKEWITWKIDTERAVYDHLSMYKESNNFTDYEKTLNILRNFDGIRHRQIDNLYLDFYRQNNLDQYRTFATFVVQEYIIPTRPDDVKKADEKRYNIIRAEIAKDMAASSGGNIDDIGYHEVSNTPALDSLSEIYTISRNIADQLYDISSDFFTLYEDESSHRKAQFWASLTHLYYPFDWKYYDNHIYMLESTGKKEEANKVLHKAQSLPWYKEMRKPKKSVQ